MSDAVIPQNLVDFARALCRVAREHGIDDMTVRFNTGIHTREMKWPAPITLMWSRRRRTTKMVLTSEVVVRAEINGSLLEEKKP